MRKSLDKLCFHTNPYALICNGELSTLLRQGYAVQSTCFAASDAATECEALFHQGPRAMPSIPAPRLTQL